MASRAFLERWRAYVQLHTKEAALVGGVMNEQEAFNRVLLGYQYRKKRASLNASELVAKGIHLLPHQPFPSGDAKTGVVRRQDLHEGHAWVHADWVRGHEAKVARLKALGVWRPECSDETQRVTRKRAGAERERDARMWASTLQRLQNN